SPSLPSSPPSPSPTFSKRRCAPRSPVCRLNYAHSPQPSRPMRSTTGPPPESTPVASLTAIGSSLQDRGLAEYFTRGCQPQLPTSRILGLVIRLLSKAVPSDSMNNSTLTTIKQSERNWTFGRYSVPTLVNLKPSGDILIIMV